MELTVEQCLDLAKTRVHVRELSMAEVCQSETDFNTHRPQDVLMRMQDLLANSGIGHISEPVIRGSHLELCSINGSKVIVDANGKNNAGELMRGLSHNDQLDVALKYNRIQVSFNIGPEHEGYRDTVGFLYSLDKRKFIAVAGKKVMICNNMNVFSDNLLFKGAADNINPALTLLEAHLGHYEENSSNLTEALNNLKEEFLTRQQIDQIISRHHYLSSCIANAQRRGVRQIFDDSLLKDAHFLMHNTEHPYRITPDGGSVYDVYNCFTEALKHNDNNLTESYDKHLATYRFFSQDLTSFLA